jgi:hypothetical protein
MTLEEFQQSITANNPSAELPHALAGLWWDAKGDWDRAHSSAMLDKSHGRAEKPFSEDSLEDEWESIAREILARL